MSRVGTSTGTTYTDTGLAASSTYSYEVQATDAAGNLSPFSNVATTTTTATIPGLVAAYSFNAGTGTTVTDSSGNGNNGTIANATWTTAGKYGDALVFNGTNALVNIPDAASLNLTTGMTLEAWVNPSTVQQRLAGRHLQGQRQLLPRGHLALQRRAGCRGHGGHVGRDASTARRP